MRKDTRRFLESRKRAAVSNPSSDIFETVASPLAGSTPAAVSAPPSLSASNTVVPVDSMPAASVESSTDQAFLVFPATTTAANETAVAAAPFDHREADLPTAVIPSTAGHSLPGSLKEQGLVDQSVAQSLPSTTVAHSLPSSLPSDTNFHGQQAGTQNDAVPLLLTQSVP